MIRSFLLFTAALVLIFPVGLQAEEAAPKEEAVQKEFNTITSTVTGIDQATHTLTLKNDIGETQEVQVDPNVVKNFSNIKVGDLVVIRQAKRWSLSLSSHKKGEKPQASATLEADKAEPGSKPGIGTAETVQVSAKVLKVDRVHNSVKLKKPDGKIVWVWARHPERLKDMKKGDMVSASYTKVKAISVEPAPKK